MAERFGAPAYDIDAPMSKSLRSHPRMSVLIALLATLFGTSRAGADDAKPRFGPNAVPIEQATGYLRDPSGA